MTWPYEHRWCTVCQHLRPHQLSRINKTDMWECVVCLEDEKELNKRLAQESKEHEPPLI